MSKTRPTKRRLTAKQRVLAKYPSAHAMQAAAGVSAGAWFIGGYGFEFLGCGVNEDEAWAHAARKLSAPAARRLK